MPAFALLPLGACLAAAAMAGALVSRDPRDRTTHLVAAILLCSGAWSLCEVLWSTAREPDQVVRLVRLSGAAWLWLGPLSLQLFEEIRATGHSRLRRALPFAWGSAAAAVLLYQTPWCVTRAVPTSFGWGYELGPLFPVAYGAGVGWVGVVLLAWRKLDPVLGSPGERRQAGFLWSAIVASLGVASTTDVLLPGLGVQVPRLGSTSILAVGCAIAIGVRRHGSFLLSSGAFAREILNTLRDGVALLRLDGRIRSCNPSLGRLVGREPGELEETCVHALLPGLDADALAAGRSRELALVTGRGERVPVAVSPSLVRDESGTPVGRVIVVRDLREVAALRAHLVTSSRLAAVGGLAAGIAHEIEAPVSRLRSHLVWIRGQWSRLLEEVEKCEGSPILDPVFAEGCDLVDEALEGVERVASVVRDVRSVADAGPGGREPLDLNAAAEAAIHVAALRSPVGVERAYGELPPVRGSSQQLEQVILNLLLNAIAAVGGSGWIRVSTEAGADGVRLRVEDDGCGIPDDVRERVFDPFFTTRPVGEATGLGLPISYQIVRAHGGELALRSRPGRGTTCEVFLPLADRPAP